MFTVDSAQLDVFEIVHLLPVLKATIIAPREGWGAIKAR